MQQGAVWPAVGAWERKGKGMCGRQQGKEPRTRLMRAEVASERARASPLILTSWFRYRLSERNVELPSSSVPTMTAESGPRPMRESETCSFSNIDVCGEST